MSKLIGRFYFKRTENGNLIGEYSHNTSKFIATECAEPIGITNGYLGTYNSTWIHEKRAIISELIISNSERSCKVFKLEWKYDESEHFWGEGFIVDGMLIGDYRDFILEESIVNK